MAEVKLNIVDRVVNYFSPGAGIRRMRSRFFQSEAKGLMRKYEAAAHGRRTAGWKATSSSANTEIHQALVTLRNRSRDIARNNPYGESAVGKIADNVTGIGIIPTPVLSSRPQEKKIKQLWQSWAGETTCDFDGHLDFYGIQNLVMRTVVESGECIVRKRIINDKNLPLALQLQVLEGDFIDTMKHGPIDGGYIFYGIEFNTAGKIVAYWLYENHPGDNYNFNVTMKSNRYPASDIIHVFEKKRPGQFRGVPVGVASMLRMKDLDEYGDAQLIRQKIAACFTAFVTDSAQPITTTTATKGDELTEKVEPGIIQYLKPGQDITFGTPPAAEGYESFTKSQLGGIALGYGMDYVTFTGDLSNVNFSSGRMGWLEFQRKVGQWQWKTFVPMFCKKAWIWFEEMAAIYNHIRPGQNIQVRWSTPRREMINPEVETAATVDSYQNGLTSWSDAVLEMGNDPEDQIEKMKADKKLFEDAGLPIYTDKTQMAAKPTAGQLPAKKTPPEN
jgi:lambda family phage portal protein